jgi:hypothetical protein
MLEKAPMISFRRRAAAQSFQPLIWFWLGIALLFAVVTGPTINMTCTRSLRARDRSGTDALSGRVRPAPAGQRQIFGGEGRR